MKKRILAFIMCALIIVSTLLTFVSCGDKEDDQDKKHLDIDWLDTLGEHDLEGYEVKFAVGEAGEDTYGFNIRSIETEENNGDKVDAAIHLRNEYIEQRFNCKITLKYKTGEDLSSEISNTLMGGGSDYDIIAGRQYNDIALCLQGYFVNLSTDERVSKYISIDREYWGGDYTRGMSYGSNVYWATGDLNLRYTGGFYGVFVNANLYNSKLKDIYGDIHDVVRDNRWTVDLMKTMSDKITNISAGTSETPGYSDIIGIAAPIHDNTNGWAVSCGVHFSERTKNGNIKLTFTQDNDRLSDYYEKYLALVSSDGCVSYGGYYEEAFKPFKTDKACFVPGRINQAELYLRTMQNDFYIIPNPMLDEEQAETIGYVSSLHDAISIYAINDDSKNIEASAIVLEAMAAESYRSVRNEYYNNALKNKYTSDPATAEMIDIISSGAYSDFALVWSFTPYFSGMGAILRMALSAHKANLTYDIATSVGNWKDGLKELRDKFDEIAAIKAKK